MKKLALFLFVVMLSICMRAQTTFINEDFDLGIGSWSTVTTGCGYPWYGTTGGFAGDYLDGTEFAFINSDPAGFCNFDDHLVSPVFDATGASTVMLEFDHYYRTYINDYGDVDVFDGAVWVTVATFNSDIGAWNAPDQQVIDITPYINANMQVRFRYVANWDWWWAVDNVLIYQPGAYNVSISSTNVTCYGDCDGQAVVSATGGTPPYSYLWSNNSTNDTISNVCAGTYFVTVIDAVPDTVISSVVITEPPLLVLDSSIVQDVSCNGDSDGTATANPTGGTPSFTYQWDALAGNQTTQIATGLAAGSYCVTVTDANACTTDTCLTVAEPLPLSSSIAGTNISCNGANDGSIDLTVSGGVPPYSFIWSNAATTEDLSGLGVGTYTVTVTDSCGTAVESVTISEPSALSLSISSTPAVSGCDGDATVTPSGGTPPYTYQWDANASNQTTQTADSLCAGQYCVSVSDSKGCTKDTCVSVVVGISDLQFTNHDLRIYPNPSTGKFVFEMDAKETGSIELRIVDMLGQAVLKQNSRQVNGKYHLNVDLSNYAKGVYQIQVKTSNGIAQKKMVLH